MPPNAPLTVCMLAYDGAQSLDICGPLEVFALASRQAQDDGRRGGPLYRTRVLGITAAPIALASGLCLVPDMAYAELPADCDTLMVSGGMGDSLDTVRADKPLLRWLCERAPQVRRLASICSGSLLLAECGLLNGRRATSHWSDVAELGRRYPQVQVQPDDLYTRDGHIWTSAGITAGMDLALAMVEADHGRALAAKVARRMVLPGRRSGGQKQLGRQLAALDSSDPFAGIGAWIQQNLPQRLDIAQLAQRTHMSPRHFSRRFAATFGTTPQKYIEALRIEAAKPLLESSTRSMPWIAAECGFGSADSMRRAFLRAGSGAPAQYRERTASA